MGRVAGHKENCPCPACKDPKERISIRIDKELDDSLEAISLQAGRNKTEVIEFILKSTVQRIKAKGESYHDLENNSGIGTVCVSQDSPGCSGR